MIQGIFSSILIVLLLMAAICDLRSRSIPDGISLAGLVLFPLAVVAGANPDWPAHLAVGAVAFAVCLALFAMGAMGGGDAKLIPVIALWAGPSGIAVFLLVMAIAGGLIALAMVARRRFGPVVPVDAASVTAATGTVPYAVAIAAGGIAALSEPVLNIFRSILSGLASSGV